MKKTFEKTLPDGYAPIYDLDAKNKKTIWVINIASLLLFAAVAVPLFMWLRILTNKSLIDIWSDIEIKQYIALIFIYVAYIFGHELVHGAAYYILTRQHLTFGTAPFVAYCGVPQIYVYRMPSLIAILAPFIVFDIAFVFGIVFAVSVVWKVVWVLALAVHVGGFIGDLWGACLLLLRFRDPLLLVRDTGPKQVFFVKKSTR